MFALVTIELLTNNLNDTYTYHIPEELEKFVGIGSRVIVDFGARRIIGYVIEVKEEAGFEGTIRDIVEVLDYSNELTQEQIDLAKMISKETKCSLIRALEVMFPPFLKTKYRKFITLKDEEKIDPNILMLFKDKKRLQLTPELIKEYPRIKKEIESGNLDLDYDVFTYGKRKQVKAYIVNKDSIGIYSEYTNARKELVEYIEKNPYCTIEDIRENLKVSKYLIDSLVKTGVLLVKSKFIPTQNEKNKVLLRNVNWTFEKKLVKDKYNNLEGRPFLLYTNDEDFSNELIYDICVDNILSDKKVLIITPTIIINFNLYHYLKKKLVGFDCLAFSSDMTQSDFYSNYMNLRNGNVEVIVATKIGATLPIDNLGAIICLDESNFNYINEMTPKFNIVEALKWRSEYHKCKLILSSNPLTVENYYNYFQTKYNILKYIKPLDHTVELVNMYDEIVNNREVISRRLEEEIRKTLANNKQVMLILNAKGYSNVLTCRSCGKVASCPKCNIPLTYYKEKNEVKCKYCGYKLDDLKCSCGEDSYSLDGMGIERVGEEVKKLFPIANVLLIDSETLRNPNDYQDVVVRIEAKDVDIIVGTNNILALNKFSSVALTGFISIDRLLNIGDYKASYNVFYLIANALKNTDLIIQGYNLDHYAIKYGISNDFVNFYNEEIKVREDFGYPPFYELNKLIITGDFSEMYHAAYYIRKVITSIFNNQKLVLGPVYVKQKRGVQLVIKHNDFNKISEILDEASRKFEKNKLTFNFERFPRSF